ncbi:ATP-binding cassette domain-containing protein [Verrucomicrobia bacterium]|nr:ATP-binding cassette domain-containing protein [Verrucomicrobiota bacterium]
MIKVDSLVKTFGPKVAVNRISFEVERGEVLGFLGPNGAGKSTTMRMITGFIPPTDGMITVGGHSIVENPIPAKRLIGYLPENAPAYPDMTVKGFLSFTAEIRGLRGSERNKAIDRVVELCSLESVIHQSVDTLSKGYRHRTCFAQSIIHDPDILILDEPTDGLDPNQKHEVRSIIKRMGEKKAIIFSTHILEEVEAVCSRAIIIDRGKIVANGTPADLKARSHSAGTVRLKLAGLSGSVAREKLSGLPAVESVTLINDDATAALLEIKGKAKVNGELNSHIADLAHQEQWRIIELYTQKGKLDEVFRNITLPDTSKGGKQS